MSKAMFGNIFSTPASTGTPLIRTRPPAVESIPRLRFTGAGSPRRLCSSAWMFPSRVVMKFFTPWMPLARAVTVVPLYAAQRATWRGIAASVSAAIRSMMPPIRAGLKVDATWAAKRWARRFLKVGFAFSRTSTSSLFSMLASTLVPIDEGWKVRSMSGRNHCHFDPGRRARQNSRLCCQEMLIA